MLSTNHRPAQEVASACLL